jgi:hypothetical protein
MMADFPPPTGKCHVRLIGGPEHGELVPLEGVVRVGPCVIFAKGFISNPVGEYRWEKDFQGIWYGKWVNSIVPR